MIRSILCAETAATFLTLAAHAETRSYDVGSFTGIDVSAGLSSKSWRGACQAWRRGCAGI